MTENSKQLQEKLWQAAAAGDCGTIRMLAASGVDINARNEDGFTAFNLATRYGHAEAATVILAAREMQFARSLGEEPADFYKFEKNKGKDKKSA